MESNPNKYFIDQEQSIKEDNIEGRVFSFDDPQQNKSTRLKINKINRILGSGSHSRWVAEVNVGLRNDTNTEKATHNMVIKRYEEMGTNAVEDLRQSYRNYKAFQKVGIPTWDTYRINETHKLALMTLGVKNNDILITANDNDELNMERFKENPVEKIENIDEFAKEASLILKKANMYGYRLRYDNYGVIFKPQQNDYK